MAEQVVDGGTQTIEPTQVGTPPQTPTAAPPQAPAPGSTGSVEDPRIKGMLADLKREREARQRFEGQVTATQAELAAERRRVQALAGVNPTSPEQAQEEEARAMLVRMFPVLGKLTEQQLDQMMQGQQTTQTFEATTNHIWQQHARQMVGSVQEQIADALGGGDLTARQKSAIARAYTAEAESNPEFLARHENSDPTLVEEFAKQWIEDWYEPARRQVTSAALNNQPRVPRGRDRSVQTTPPKPVNFGDDKATADALVESFKRHGGSFGA